MNEQLSLEQGDGFTLVSAAWERRHAVRSLRAKGYPIETRGRGKTHLYRQNDGAGYLLAKLTAPGRLTFRLFRTAGDAVNVSAVATLLPVPAPRLSRTGVQKPKKARNKTTGKRAK